MVRSNLCAAKWTSRDTNATHAKFTIMKTLATSNLSDGDISRIVEMAWEDRTPFEAIRTQFGLNESAVIELMRGHMKTSSFKLWRERMKGRVTKHAALRSEDMNDGSRHVARHRIPQR